MNGDITGIDMIRMNSKNANNGTSLFFLRLIREETNKIMLPAMKTQYNSIVEFRLTENQRYCRLKGTFSVREVDCGLKKTVIMKDSATENTYIIF